MKIGLFTDTYFPQVSGVSTSIKLLKDELIKRGHQVIIFTTTDPQARGEEGIVRLPSVPFVSFEDRRVAYGGFDRCLKIAREYELDIVHTHTEFSLGLAGRFVASRLKIPTVHTYHTMYENYTHYILKGYLIRPLHVKLLSKMFCSGADGIIAPSQLTYDTLRQYGIKEKMAIIPTGVTIPTYDANVKSQLRQQLNLADDHQVLLSLSRLSKEKNIAAVIEAMAMLHPQLPQARLVIVGDGPERDALEKQVTQLQLQSCVQFTGQIDHDSVWKYYQMADLYVNASTSESQGLTYLEAFANQLPIIAKRNDYLAEIMTNASFGQLFEEEETFAQTILAYLTAKQANEIAPIDSQLLRPLSADYFGEQVEQFYQEVIQTYQQTENGWFDRIYQSAKELYHDIMLGE